MGSSTLSAGVLLECSAPKDFSVFSPHVSNILLRCTSEEFQICSSLDEDCVKARQYVPCFYTCTSYLNLCQESIENGSLLTRKVKLEVRVQSEIEECVEDIRELRDHGI